MGLSVKQIIEEVKKLPSEDKERVITALQQKVAPRKKHKISEIEGVGAEIWRSIDVEKYIEEERESWNP